MLRVSVEQNRDALFFVVEGRLVGPWVDELRAVWEQRSGGEKNSNLTVDLCGLTAMDSSGQNLLQELLNGGASLRCSDVMNQYLVEQLGASSERLEACRSCRHFAREKDETAGATALKSSGTSNAA